MSKRRSLRDQRVVGLLILAGASFTAAQIPGDALESMASTELAGAASLPDATGPPPAPAPEAVAAGATADWWSAVSADLARREYDASTSSAGLQAPNRAHDVRTYFREDRIEVVPRTTGETAPSWRFTWRTTGFGRGDRTEAAGPPDAPRSEGSRVTYARAAFDEWYVNGPAGVEQGFTVPERPEGSGALRIVGAIGQGLQAVYRADEAAVDLLDANEVRVLRYGALEVRDAVGAEVPSRLEAAGSELALVIEDRAAVYPLTVDPLLTSTAWTVESNQSDAYLGWSVATAGDVNGDGFSDVIVGAYYYDNGQADEGRAYVYHGSALGLSTLASWAAESDQAGASFGTSVSTAGDVNGDGYSDVIIGADRYDDVEVDEGHVFVYLGSSAGLSTAGPWRFWGCDQTGAHFGQSVSTAGDVNGDGWGDVIVGAHMYDNGQIDEGRAFVYLGSPIGLWPVWTAESDQVNAHFGWSVSTAGDVNGDGYGDVVVGAHDYDSGQGNEGRASVYLGSAAGLSASASWTALGDQGSAAFGVSVSTAGDVNGDGYSDVIVGAHMYDNGQINEGRAFVFHGSAAGPSASASWTAESDQAWALFGQSTATAGDVNGDGYSDVIVGASGYDDGQTNEGRALVYYGSAAGLSVSAGWTTESDQASAGFGRSVATAGDVNGDGYADVIVGAPYCDNGQTDEGRAYAYHGSATGISLAPVWTPATDIDGTGVASAGDVNGDGYGDVITAAHLSGGRYAAAFHGSAAGLATSPAWFGQSGTGDLGFTRALATAGDVNGDGYDDVIIGVGGWPGGVACVHHGSASGLSSAPDWWMASEDSSNFARSVAGAGDVNGDGYGDVIVGAPEYPDGYDNEGRAYVYHGSASGLSSTPAWIAEGEFPTRWFGHSVATAGDVNGDGYSDVIVGAELSGVGGVGRAFVYHGSASGLSTSPNWMVEGSDCLALGFSVSTAGDVNGDGYSDVIVSAAIYQPYNESGAVYVHLGSAAGLAQVPASIMVGSQEDDWFGCSVATAGDVDGDGYSDVIVGAEKYDNGEVDEGRAYVYFGSEAGIAMARGWTAESNQTSARLGTCVASAGDVNGDGYSDVLGGAWAGDNAYVFYVRGGASPVTALRQVCTDGITPIPLLGRSDSEVAFSVKAQGHTAAGRGKVRLVVEVKPFGTPFNGTGLVSGPMVSTGMPGPSGSVVALSQIVGGLTPSTYSHWRARVVTTSPYFPGSRWFWVQGNGVAEADLRGHVDDPFTYSTYTGTGTNVHVTLGPAVTATFDQVTSEGVTSVTLEESGPPPPTGFRIVPTLPPLYYDLSTTATFTGLVTVCMTYDDADVMGEEADLKMYHYDGGSPGWVDVTSSLDTVANVLCGRTATLSPFVIVEPHPGVGIPETRTVVFGLAPVAPSPFREATTIRFGLPHAGVVDLRVFDVAGRRVRALANGPYPAGSHALVWDGRDDRGDRVASGVYFVRLTALGKEETRRVVRMN